MGYASRNTSLMRLQKPAPKMIPLYLPEGLLGTFTDLEKYYQSVGQASRGDAKVR
jgi:hypothetical protein